MTFFTAIATLTILLAIGYSLGVAVRHIAIRYSTHKMSRTDSVRATTNQGKN